MGEISKALFGTLTQSDAKSYNENILELEKDEKEFVHLAKEQMTVIKTTTSSINSTLQRVDQNERIMDTELNRLFNYNIQDFSELKGEVGNVNLLNEQLRLIQRGVEECQHTFEVLIFAFVHAGQGILQPQLMPTKKIRNYIKTQKLPSGTDYPNFPFPEMLKIRTPKKSIYIKM
jgi:hypothetical protein